MSPRPYENKTDLLKGLLSERIMVLDGAMGTMIQARKLTRESFSGERFADHSIDLQGCNDLLCLTQPDVIKTIHREFLEADADIVSTNTFNSTSIAMADYRLEEFVYEINKSAAELARQVVDEFNDRSPDRPRFVAGSIGPTNRTASVSVSVEDAAKKSITFDELVESYDEQVRGLVDGGVDILMPETSFDTLNMKACLFAIDRYFDETGITIPMIVSFTIIQANSHRTMSMQSVEALHTSIEHMRPLSIGMNCALGADDMRADVETLSRISPFPVSCHPNAGLPNELGDFDHTPKFMAKVLGEFASNGWLNIVGGCCGTTPDHIQAIAAAVKGLSPRVPPQVPRLSRYSGLDQLDLRTDSNFVMVG
jgi:5-methyltetrahydrofolate--homocysteine methyltransferase